MIQERIVNFMPFFLTKEAKHKLVINSFITAIKIWPNYFTFFGNRGLGFGNKNCIEILQFSEINDLILRGSSRIEKFNVTFRHDILNENEKHQAIQIIKYILYSKLQTAVNQLKNDFDIFLPYMKLFNKGPFSANYESTFFKFKVNLDDLNIDEVIFPEIKLNEVISNDKRFKPYSDKYLAYEILNINKSGKKAESKSFLNAYELSLLKSYYEDMSSTKSITNYDSVFQGEGGTLDIKMTLFPKKVLQLTFLRSILTLILSIIFFCAYISFAVIVMYNNDEVWSLLPLFPGGFFGLYLGLMCRERIHVHAHTHSRLGFRVRAS